MDSEKVAELRLQLQSLQEEVAGLKVLRKHVIGRLNSLIDAAPAAGLDLNFGARRDWGHDEEEDDERGIDNSHLDPEEKTASETFFSELSRIAYLDLGGKIFDMEYSDRVEHFWVPSTC